MKKLVLLASICAAVMSGCTDEYSSDTQKLRALENSYNAFGVTFSTSQDWSSTSNGTVSVTANADLDDIAKVQILTRSPFGNADANGATVLNEVEVEKGQTVTLAYDAPAHLTRLYAACVSSDGHYRIQVFSPEESEVSFVSEETTRGTRASSVSELPANPKIDRTATTYNSDRAKAAANGDNTYSLWYNSGWENDTYYQLSDAAEITQVLQLDDMTDKEKETLAAIVEDYLPAVKWVNSWTRINNNRETIVGSDLFKFENNYLTTTGTEPIVLAPVYAKSSGSFSCHIYYYYYRPEQLAGMSEEEQILFLKNLPKYKAIQTWRTFKDTSKQKVFFRKDGYTLIYYGDDTPQKGKTTGTYVFPEGYKIGIMQMNTKEGGGCLYSDGRLNAEINQFGNFAKSNLEPNDPRQAFLDANGKIYVCFEDGADQDFRDIIIEINGGVAPFNDTPDVDHNVYTFCFEDRDDGDYDLNDVVIKAQRVDQTHVKYSIEAVGSDEVYLRNINGTLLNEEVELHSLFDVSVGHAVNVNENLDHVAPVQEVIAVRPDFSFTDANMQVYIYNKSSGKDIKLSSAREDPHALMIPCDFCYPQELVCIKEAYGFFTTWGRTATSCTDWYLYPNEGKVYTKSIFE
mgnify:CR=1 FL=1